MKTFIAICSLALVLPLAACSDETAAPPAPDLAQAQSNPDLSMPSGPPADLGCYGMPMTHVEIINACTTAQSFDKTPFYPSLAPGGNLPPLP